MANFTKQAIKAAFLELLDEKPLNKISVRDIVERCGINRNSFYYHFQDIPSLLGEIDVYKRQEEARRIINESIKGGENKKREMLLEAKEEIHKSRTEYEKEVKERRSEIQKQERRLQQKEESLDKKLDLHEKKEEELAKKAASIQNQQEAVSYTHLDVYKRQG